MTTIAANLQEMAADTQVSDGTEAFRVSSKIHRIPGGWAAYCGHVHAGLAIIEWLQKPRKRKPSFGDDDQASVLILDKDGLAYVDTGLRIIRLQEPFWAMGTGSQAALTAMHLGYPPAAAVEVACRIDPNSRAPVNVVELAATARGSNVS